MIRVLRRLAPSLRPFALRREDGTAAMEFVLVVPVILAIFMGSFESGLLMTREILLERAVDMTMRELRLGHYSNVTNVLLQKEICSRTIVFPDCENNIKIQLDRISTTTWQIPAVPSYCVDKGEPTQPVTSLNTGQDNDLMLIRVCVTLPAILPTMGLALHLPMDGHGNYGLIAKSAFVVEPS